MTWTREDGATIDEVDLRHALECREALNCEPRKAILAALAPKPETAPDAEGALVVLSAS